MKDQIHYMAQKPLPEDFRDFIESLNSNKVEYILIGGWGCRTSWKSKNDKRY